MEFSHITYQGPPIDDLAVLEKVPSELRQFLEQMNGFIQFGGGLHIRGACHAPVWHSLSEMWFGPLALSRLFQVIDEADVPFGQDALGDQFILREGVVHQLLSETGDLTSLECGFFEFLNAVQNDPVEYLSLYALSQFYNEGGELEPGQLLSAYPPFCTTQSESGVSLKAVDAADRIQFLSDFAAQIEALPDGAHVAIKFGD